MPDEAQHRQTICEIGRRLYARGFASANDGNLSIRLDEERVLCTPTLISKGFMNPEDLCVVDLDGHQLSGERKRTSEVLAHLALYRQNEETCAVVHCHPPYPTAFSIAREPIPTGILPEVEVFLGAIPTVPYQTPGTPALSEALAPHATAACIAVLQNHGTIAWSDSLEHAYWWTEMLDSYCRMLLIARQVGSVGRLSEDDVRTLLSLRSNFGMPPDPRVEGSAGLYQNLTFGR